MSLSKWWAASREILRLAQLRPYSFWLGGGYFASALAGLALVMVADSLFGWRFFPELVILFYSPVFLFHIGLVVYFVHRHDQH